MAPETTDINQELIRYIRRISDDLHRLAEIAERHAPLLDAYQRGGLLAARAYRKAGNGKRD